MGQTNNYKKWYIGDNYWILKEEMEQFRTSVIAIKEVLWLKHKTSNYGRKHFITWNIKLTNIPRS